jgi:hypothetical protein
LCVVCCKPSLHRLFVLCRDGTAQGMDAKTLFAPRPTLQQWLVPLLNEWLPPELTALVLDDLRAGAVPALPLFSPSPLSIGFDLHRLVPVPLYHCPRRAVGRFRAAPDELSSDDYSRDERVCAMRARLTGPEVCRVWQSGRLPLCPWTVCLPLWALQFLRVTIIPPLNEWQACARVLLGPGTVRGFNTNWRPTELPLPERLRVDKQTDSKLLDATVSFAVAVSQDLRALYVAADGEPMATAVWTAAHAAAEAAAEMGLWAGPLTAECRVSVSLMMDERAVRVELQCDDEFDVK